VLLRTSDYLQLRCSLLMPATCEHTDPNEFMSVGLRGLVKYLFRIPTVEPDIVTLPCCDCSLAGERSCMRDKAVS
jgi:hypothetical protein